MDSAIQLLNNWGLNERGSIYVNLLKISIPASEDARPVVPGPSSPKVINASPKLACVAAVNRGREKGKEFERAVSCPNSLPLSFRTPATQASPELVNKKTHVLFIATLGFAALIFLRTIRFCGSRSQVR